MKKRSIIISLSLLACIISGCQTANEDPPHTDPPIVSAESTSPTTVETEVPQTTETAPQEFECDNFLCRIDDDSVEILGYAGIEGVVEIPEELNGYPVVSIREHAFEADPTLQSITIPKTVRNIGSNPFILCTNLKEINVSPENPAFESIDGILYSTDESVLISYPNAKEMEEFIIPDGVEVIGREACYDCNMLTSVIIPDSVVIIDDRAFAHSTKLYYVEMPGSIVEIGEGAFGVCQKLTIYEIPEGVESIGASAFIDCLGLYGIKIPSTVTYIGNNIFYGCSKLAEISVAEDNPVFSTIDGSLVKTEEKKLVAFPIGSWELDYTLEYVIPEGIEIIGEKAFWGSGWNLKTVVIPDGVHTIEDKVFQFSWVENVTIPASVTHIGEKVFDGCPSALVIKTASGSYGEHYCIENGLNYEIIE